MAGIVVIFFPKNKKISSHMSHISEQINPSNRKIYSYEQKRL